MATSSPVLAWFLCDALEARYQSVSAHVAAMDQAWARAAARNWQISPEEEDDLLQMQIEAVLHLLAMEEASRAVTGEGERQADVIGAMGEGERRPDVTPSVFCVKIQRQPIDHQRQPSL